MKILTTYCIGVALSALLFSSPTFSKPTDCYIDVRTSCIAGCRTAKKFGAKLKDCEPPCKEHARIICEGAR